MKHLLALILLVAVSGCRTTRPDKIWHGGPWEKENVQALAINIQRAGLPKDAINKYQLRSKAVAGTRQDSTGAWYTDDYYAYNEKTGLYRHTCVYVTDPGNMDAPPPMNIIRHEQLHSLIESSPEHKGMPLPREYRRGGDHFHPREVYIAGQWHQAAVLCQDRWPRRVGRWILRREYPDVRCGVEGDSRHWEAP